MPSKQPQYFHSLLRAALLLLCIVWGALSHMACRREIPLHRDADRALSFTKDTMRFDSVFVGHTSMTQRMALRNHYVKSIRLERVDCPGAKTMGYSILMDGRPLPAMAGTVIPPGDSLVIVVRLNPSQAETDTITPCLCELMVHYEHGSARLTLYAQALRVEHCTVDTIRRDTLFSSYPARLLSRPLVVLAGATLTIAEGAGLYFTQDAGLRVEGKLMIEGTAKHPVILAGQRLETYYRRRPGQWAGIHLTRGSGPHSISHAQVRGAVTGLTADSLDGGAPLRVENCRFEFCSLSGLEARECSLKVVGCIFLQNYRNALYLEGADALLVHGTLYAETNPPDMRKGPLLRLIQQKEGRASHLWCFNSVVWGDREEEIQIVNHAAVNPTQCWVEADASIIRLSEAGRAELGLAATVKASDPSLKDPLKGECALLPKSPARGWGARGWSLSNPVDMMGIQRLTGAVTRPDAGALVYHE